jgi:hypothetical protein
VTGLFVAGLLVTELFGTELFRPERGSDRSAGVKAPKSISGEFVKTQFAETPETEHKLMRKHPIESQQIDSRPFA